MTLETLLRKFTIGRFAGVFLGSVLNACSSAQINSDSFSKIDSMAWITNISGPYTLVSPKYFSPSGTLIYPLYLAKTGDYAPAELVVTGVFIDGIRYRANYLNNDGFLFICDLDMSRLNSGGHKLECTANDGRADYFFKSRFILDKNPPKIKVRKINDSLFIADASDDNDISAIFTHDVIYEDDNGRPLRREIDATADTIIRYQNWGKGAKAIFSPVHYGTMIVAALDMAGNMSNEVLIEIKEENKADITY